MKYAKFFVLVLAVLFAVNFSVYAEPAEYQENINLEFYASKYISIDKKISRIFIGSSDIVNVRQPADSASEFVITAKDKKGSTTLFIWTADGARHEYLVNVVDEEIGQAAIIEEAIGLPDVHVKKVGDRILLTGTVKNQYERNYALQTARLYVDDNGSNNLSVGSNVEMQLDTSSAKNASSSGVKMNTLESGGKIIDLLEMKNPIQIRLEAQVVEINSDDAKDLGVQYGVARTGGIFYFGEDYVRSSNPTSFRNNPIRWAGDRFGSINGQINALVTKRKARILSRPSVTTMSGEQATIHIGGKIPYQSTDDNGKSNTEFENYGIILQFKPIVDEKNRITSAVHTEVSAPSGEAVNGQPIIDTRFADSVVNVYSGSTMVVGGLMDSSVSKSVQKIPLLGDIPVLGEFFKYTSKSRDKRELIILVTPYIVSEEDISHTGMTDNMRDYYYDGQREHNNLNDIDVNALPPPFEENDKKSKKDKKSKQDKKSKNEKKSKQDKKSEQENFDEENNNRDENPGVEIFGDF